MFLESKGEYEPKFMIRKPKKPSVPSTESNQGEKRKNTSNNNNQILAANKQKKIDTKNCEECDECKGLTPKKDLSLGEDGKILCRLCWATAHPDPLGLVLDGAVAQHRRPDLLHASGEPVHYSQIGPV